MRLIMCDNKKKSSTLSKLDVARMVKTGVILMIKNAINHIQGVCKSPAPDQN